MKIKKYIASNIQEGKNRVFEDLGEDAVILSVRSISSNEDMENNVEIIAAIETKSNSTSAGTSLDYFASNENINEELSLIDENDKYQFQFNRLFNEIENIKTQVYELTEIIRFKNISALSPNARKLYKILIDSGISENMVLNTIIRLNISDSKTNIKDMVRDAGKILLEKINFSGSISKTDKQQIIGFIGSNGSGKTTTLIKLAIVCKLVYEGKVLIISADNIKIGGADQLQSYASIASIPYRAVESNEELLEIIKNETNYDYIFIDSAGVPLHNLEIQNEANEILNSVDFTHKYLLVQSNLSKSAAKATLNIFKKWKPTSIILTKIDETIRYGEIYEALQTTLLPIAYFSSGYSIPDDIEQAEKKTLIELLLPDLHKNNNLKIINNTNDTEIIIENSEDNLNTDNKNINEINDSKQNPGDDING